ncbi:MAG: methyl-accepting chemotaxis protein [Anaeromicrobium sp.]|uniref:methyl-accepting chemotaxis protein n=1 Tax=Anaeromicrobium sp. TaxID=1929132 RepID=UPI0025E72DA2|nr:methyl-accepting chemotaxis protein [Anaeromicrobium sp.]MCT4595548.1 methyl-accepting chemotaxis protein [Anaeromicrobium sp.]
MKMSLKTKLISMFFIFISVPLIILGIISSNMASNSMEHLTEEELRQITEDASKAINQSIYSVDKYVQVLSHNKDFANIAIENIEDDFKVFQYLKTLQEENSEEIEKIIITDKFGKGVISSDDKNYNVDLSNRSYVQSALKGSKYISEVIISKVSKNPIIGIAYPLKINDEIVGTITGTIKFENVSKHVSHIKVGQKGYAYMIDKNGLFVYHPEKEKVLEENIKDRANDQLNKLIERMELGKEGEGYYEYEGERKFVRFTPSNKWIVAVTADYDEYMAVATTIKRNTFVITVVSLIMAMFLAYSITTRNIINPIKKLEELMINAGNGDLTVKSNITTKDEIQTLGECFNEMIEHQSNVISHVRKGAEDLASASQEVSASTEEVSVSTEEITSNIQEVAANAEEQNNTIIETSEVLVQLSSLIQIAQIKATKAKDNSRYSKIAAEKGRNNVEKTVEAIENINKVSTETAHILKELNELSNKVSGIIETINKISDQTNLLALNAAIEAARAGEHGKGFTVVADEVRKLSEQTSVEANEIGSLVNQMVTQINAAVRSMNSSKRVVQKGVIVANETDESFVSIINAVEQIVNDIEQIVNVTKDEVASSDQIINLIDAVATITETTATNSEEVAKSTEEQSSVIENLAASAEETSAMANSLNDLVVKFKIGGE